VPWPQRVRGQAEIRQDPKGSKWLRTSLTEAAKAAARSKGTYLAAQHARLKGRRGPGKATIAVGHSILVSAYYMLDRGQGYADLGADYFVHRHDPARHAQTRSPASSPRVRSLPQPSGGRVGRESIFTTGNEPPFEDISGDSTRNLDFLDPPE
jgi:hypothetical protein